MQDRAVDDRMGEAPGEPVFETDPGTGLRPPETRVWLWLAIGLSLASAAWTLFLAANANQIWEEAHFRLAGAQPDWGYPDTPVGAPLLAAWSEQLFGDGRLGPRVLSWFFGSLFPLATWFFARPLTTPRRALVAACLAAIIPVFVTGGVYAYPEAPMQTLAAAFMGGLIRAIRSDRAGWWIFAGLLCAAGVAYYYRFWFLPFGLLVFLVATKDGRSLWTRPAAWLGGSIALLGLAPSLIDNLTDAWRPVLFQLAGRQDWAFWPRAILYPVEQAGLVSPLIFLFILGGAAVALWRWRREEDGFAAMTLITAGALTLPFFALAFFDRDYLPHWPFLGWAMLLPFVPEAMATFIELARTRGLAAPARLIVGAASALAVIITLLFGANLLLWRYPLQLAEADRLDWLQGGDLEDWTTLRPTIAAAFEAAGPGAVLVASDHITAAQLQTAGGASAPVIVLDHPDDASRSFQAYRSLRGEGEDRLDFHEGAPAVIVLREPAYLYREAERVNLRLRICERFSRVRRQDSAWLEPGRVRVSVFTATIGGNRSAAERGGGACPFLPYAVIEQPVSGAVVSGEIPVYGAAAHPEGVSRVLVFLDGERVAADRSLIDLPGYRFPEALAFDPNYPEVYWDVRVDLSDVPPGRHELSLAVRTQEGRTIRTETRVIYVR